MWDFCVMLRLHNASQAGRAAMRAHANFAARFHRCIELVFVLTAIEVSSSWQYDTSICSRWSQIQLSDHRMVRWCSQVAL